jgi:hypothetical protein
MSPCGRDRAAAKSVIDNFPLGTGEHIQQVRSRLITRRHPQHQLTRPYAGTSTLQGLHHVAQKSRRMTLPL